MLLSEMCVSRKLKQAFESIAELVAEKKATLSDTDFDKDFD